MVSYIPYIGPMLITVILVPTMILISKKFEILDLPNQRKIHENFVSRLGGVAMFLAVFISLVSVFFINKNYTMELFWKYILVGSLMAFALGLWDDLKNISPKKKLVFQISLATITTLMGFKIHEIQMGFDHPMHLGHFSGIITVLWIVTVMNAVNMIDGLDGLAGGFSFLVFLTIAILGYLNKNSNVMILSFACAGACLGFLIFNFHPAKIFMGDSGSMAIGYIFAILSVSTGQASMPVSVFTPLFLLAFPLIDLITSILRRMIYAKTTEKRISLFHLVQRTFNADGNHIHHRLLKLGFSQRKIAFIIYGFTILNCIMGVASVYFSFTLILFLFIFYCWFAIQSIRSLDYEEFVTRAYRDQRKIFEEKQKLSTAPSLIKKVL